MKGENPYMTPMGMVRYGSQTLSFNFNAMTILLKRRWGMKEFEGCAE